jgi:hypothetical protein
MIEFEANSFAKKFCFGASGIDTDGLYNSQSISLICSLNKAFSREYQTINISIVNSIILFFSFFFCKAQEICALSVHTHLTSEEMVIF